jgi:uroporphyrinogen decarboxylase
MKKSIAKVFAVALVAATSFQTVAAQQQVANNRRERILQVLDQSRPNAYVPAAFFLHFENKLGRKAVDDHRAFYKATNMDFVKVFYEIAVPKVEINSGKDWEKVPVYGEDYFAPQVAVIADLAREFGGEAFVLPTVYSPLSLAHQTLGRGKDFKKLIEEDPKAFGKAIKNLALSIENYLRSARKAGADGFYVSSQGGDGNSLPEKIWKEQVREWDKYVSQVANEIGEINILHIYIVAYTFRYALSNGFPVVMPYIFRVQNINDYIIERSNRRIETIRTCRKNQPVMAVSGIVAGCFIENCKSVDR